MSATYLDHAATTPVRPEVLAAMAPFYDERFGNPSSVHAFGRQARAALEDARERVAAALGATRAEIVFTSGGTEADNLAILGPARAALQDGGHAVIACSAVEHKAVLSAAARTAREGATIVLIGVDGNGAIELDAIEQALQERPVALSVMWVNNEVGAVQPVGSIAERCAEAGVVFHTDAVQAFGRVPVTLHDGIGLLTISGHKLGAPKGIGALFVRDGIPVVGLQHGGSQEHGVRPGTENVAAAVGLATAVELAAAERAAEAVRLGALRDALQQALVGGIPDLAVNAASGERAPHILNVSVAGIDQDALLVGLDLEGIAVSTASACQSGAGEPSHVLVAMGRSMDDAAVLRVSLGRTTMPADTARAADVIPRVVKSVRAGRS